MNVIDLGKEFPSVLDRAYTRYKRNLANYRKVEEVMSKDVVTITPKASMQDAAVLMGKKRIGSLIVETYKTPVGIITERDLLSKVLALGKPPKKEKVETLMSYPLITVRSTATIKEAAKLMIQKKGRLAVFDCGYLVGIITASDLIRSLPEAPETTVKVDEFMTKEVVTADENVTIDHLAKMMGEKRIGSVIITVNGKPTGIFTERDLLTTFLATQYSLTTKVGAAVSSPLITIKAGMSIHAAARTMAIKHVRRLPIIKDSEMVGIITARDLVEAYAR